MGTVANDNLEQQGCHPFYESVITNPFVTEVRTVCLRRGFNCHEYGETKIFLNYVLGLALAMVVIGSGGHIDHNILQVENLPNS